MSTTLNPVPLLDYLARIGGLSKAPGIAGLHTHDEQSYENGNYQATACVERTPEEDRKYAAAQAVVMRAAKRDWITHEAADQFCIDILKVHPCEVFGESWFLPMPTVDLDDIERRIIEGSIRTVCALGHVLGQEYGLNQGERRAVKRDLDPAVLAWIDDELAAALASERTAEYALDAAA